MDDKFFENARGMFMTQGWKDFIAEVQEAVDSCRIENINDEKAFRQMKGEMEALHRILGYENYITHLEAQEAEDAQDL